MKKIKIKISDKALANAVKKKEIDLSDLSKSQRSKISDIIKTTSDKELDIASKNKYKFSKRKVVHISKNKNESMEQNKDDFKKIITNIKDWEDKIKGGLAKDKKPSDYDLDDLSKGSSIQMEHTDDPEEAIDIAMDHLEEFDDYYDDEKGLPAMERELEDDDDDDDIEEVDEITSDDEDFNDDEKINDMKMENSFIKKFNNFLKINESDEPSEPKMYPRENKFKRLIEFDDEIEQSLIQHHFTKSNNKKGYWIIFDIMNKTFEIINDMPDDIRPCDPNEFDHIMENL